MDHVHILLASKKPASVAALATALLCRSDCRVSLTDSAAEARELIGNTDNTVAVVDKELKDSSGLQFIQEAIAINPFINCALLSALPPGEFHEQTEGLGIFMQVPPAPTSTDAGKLLEHLGRILELGRPAPSRVHS